MYQVLSVKRFLVHLAITSDSMLEKLGIRLVFIVVFVIFVLSIFSLYFLVIQSPILFYMHDFRHVYVFGLS